MIAQGSSPAIHFVPLAIRRAVADSSDVGILLMQKSGDYIGYWRFVFRLQKSFCINEKELVPSCRRGDAIMTQ
jgi:hypothetical protein